MKPHRPILRSKLPRERSVKMLPLHQTHFRGKSVSLNLDGHIHFGRERETGELPTFSEQTVLLAVVLIKAGNR